MLQLQKKYSISAKAEISQILTQQYIGFFCIVEKVDYMSYKLDVPPNWRIHLVLFMAQLEPASAPAKDLFARFF